MPHHRQVRDHTHTHTQLMWNWETVRIWLCMQIAQVVERIVCVCVCAGAQGMERRAKNDDGERYHSRVLFNNARTFGYHVICVVNANTALSLICNRMHIRCIQLSTGSDERLWYLKPSLFYGRSALTYAPKFSRICCNVSWTSFIGFSDARNTNSGAGHGQKFNSSIDKIHIGTRILLVLAVK